MLATGFSWQLPDCLAGLAHRFELDPGGRPVLDRTYRLGWDAPDAARIYMQNGGEHSHGIADAQLSLMAWRAATIINDAAGREVYDLTETDPVVGWRRMIDPPVDDEAKVHDQGPPSGVSSNCRTIAGSPSLPTQPVVVALGCSGVNVQDRRSARPERSYRNRGSGPSAKQMASSLSCRPMPNAFR